MENNIINVAFVTDDGYFKYMFVAIESLIKTVNVNYKLDVYILDNGIEEDNIQKLNERYKNLNRININIIKPTIQNLSKLKLKTHISSAAFSKIYIADFIEVDKIIYLDCDLMVREDIAKLWEKFEDDVPLKAVWNPFYNYDNKHMGLSEDARTFNSGVMLLNLKSLRKMEASTRLLEFLNEYNDKTELHDQAAFNAVFKKEWKELDYRWNYQVSMILSSYKNLDITKNEYSDMYQNPYIVHFTSNTKPWQLRNSHPYKKEYLDVYSELFDSKLDVNNYFIDSLKRIKEIYTYKKMSQKNSK